MTKNSIERGEKNREYMKQRYFCYYTKELSAMTPSNPTLTPSCLFLNYKILALFSIHPIPFK